MLGLEELQAYTATQAEDLAVQTEDVHFEFYLCGECITAELADKRVRMVRTMSFQVRSAAQDVTAAAKQVTVRMGESDVCDYLAFALDLE